jgi:hypothetical protein
LQDDTIIAKEADNMSVAIRIEDELYRQAETTARAESRTPPLQIQYWAKIGKAALDNPDLPVEFIKSILTSEGQPSELFEFRRK